MRHQSCRVAVLGDGGWGTTLAIHLHRCGHRVTWWGAFPAYVRELSRARRNRKFLPGIPIPRSLPITADLREAVQRADIVLLAVPSQHLRAVAHRLRGRLSARAIIVSAAKGFEAGSLKRMSQVITEELGPVRVAALSGPNIALEIARGHPASSVVAAREASLATMLQAVLMDGRLRVYTSTDLIGVECGGALKNPIAIAAGVSDGLGFGSNAKAALITRGVVEMARLGTALGARPSTFWGLSGLGDLVTTCLSGRNHRLGVQLGRGRTLKSVLSSTPMVVEGVETARAAVALGARRGVDLPIITQVHAILFQNRPPQKALQALMIRAGRAER